MFISSFVFWEISFNHTVYGYLRFRSNSIAWGEEGRSFLSSFTSHNQTRCSCNIPNRSVFLRSFYDIGWIKYRCFWPIAQYQTPNKPRIIRYWWQRCETLSSCILSTWPWKDQRIHQCKPQERRHFQVIVTLEFSMSDHDVTIKDAHPLSQIDESLFPSSGFSVIGRSSTYPLIWVFSLSEVYSLVFQYRGTSNRPHSESWSVLWASAKSTPIFLEKEERS